jgi:limonene-1,2-epoxide hydrolase
VVARFAQVHRQLGPNLLEWWNTRRLRVEQPDQVSAIDGVDRFCAELPDLEPDHGVRECGRQFARHDPADIAAVTGGGIGRVLSRQRGEVSAGTQLYQQRISQGLRSHQEMCDVELQRGLRGLELLVSARQLGISGRLQNPGRFGRVVCADLEPREFDFERAAARNLAS